MGKILTQFSKSEKLLKLMEDKQHIEGSSAVNPLLIALLGCFFFFYVFIFCSTLPLIQISPLFYVEGLSKQL